WELATKFYLFCPADAMLANRQQTVAPDLYDYLGPNLADSLGAKMRKILQQQMQLSRHPLAVTTLPLPVNTVQALIKGWLFYRDAEFIESGGAVDGVAADHCRGHIWTQADLRKLSFDGALLLDRLEWLAPAQVNAEAMWDTETLMQNVVRSFEVSKAPLMLVLFSKCEGLAREASRGMVVPDAWWSQAQDARLRLRT
ncbi:MAG: DUF1853 family protein, partial [Burkholderiales bacterium]|nr:DUF1853 family protein [Burkholderiales bacterium]